MKKSTSGERLKAKRSKRPTKEEGRPDWKNRGQGKGSRILRIIYICPLKDLTVCRSRRRRKREGEGERLLVVHLLNEFLTKRISGYHNNSTDRHRGKWEKEPKP